MTDPNERQVGGDHYKVGGEEHWDRAWRLEYDMFQYIITKWVERWRKKGGVEDLKKARHALDKYIALTEKEEGRIQGIKAGASSCVCYSGSWPPPKDYEHHVTCPKSEEGAAGPEYVDQD